MRVGWAIVCVAAALFAAVAAGTVDNGFVVWEGVRGTRCFSKSANVRTTALTSRSDC